MKNVVFKLISSLGVEQIFVKAAILWESMHVCVFVSVWVCVSLPPAVEGSETVCGPVFGQLSTFQKDLFPAAEEQAEWGQKLAFVGVVVPLFFS